MKFGALPPEAREPAACLAENCSPPTAASAPPSVPSWSSSRSVNKT